MPETPKDKDLDETKRIMERLVKTPPNPKAKPEKHEAKPQKDKTDDHHRS
ncbi:hypothetical protein [Mesorhizobium sp. P5_C1]